MTTATRRFWPRVLLTTSPLLSTRRALPHITLSKVLAGGPARPVTFPSTPLAVKVRVALGADLTADPLTWAWQDITDRVRFSPGISVTAGRPDESSKVSFATGELVLDNRDGRFTRRNPISPYYGLLSKNTPIWGTIDAGSGEKDRLQLFVNEWPNRWADLSANDTFMTIKCAGILRRLQQGSALRSALRRAVLSAGPVGYWPLEDGTDAAVAASGIGGHPLSITGTVDFGTAEGPGGSLPLPDHLLDLGGELVVANYGTTTTAWGLSFIASFPPDNYPTEAVLGAIASWTVPGHSLYNRFQLASDFGEADTIQLSAFDYSGVQVTLGGVFTITRNVYHHFLVWQTQNGSNIETSMYLDGVLSGPDVRAGTNGTTGVGQLTISPIIDEFGLDSTYQAAAVSLGHWAIWDSTVDPAIISAAQAAAVNGYTGEMAHVRMARLCAEENIPFESLASTSPTLGPQPVGTLINALRDAETAGCGVLYEKRWGLAYQSVAERYNAPVGLALDIDQGHIAQTPQFADDDQRTRNVWTVTRSNDGSEYTARLTAGPMGTGAQGPGTYDASETVNTETDNQLPSQAGWRRHLGTVDEDRWPNLALNFARNSSLIDTWCSLPYGARVTVANPLTQMPPDPLDLVVEGYSEAWDPFVWVAQLNTSPASPYRVHVVASTDGNLGRVDSGTATLAADATSSDTTISVASTGPLWRTGTVNFDISVGGERMTVTNISGSSSPQTFTVTRSVNGVVKAQLAMVGGFATTVRLWRPGVYGL